MDVRTVRLSGWDIFYLIISAKRKPLDLTKRKIELPIWQLAPLYLNKGGKLWGAYGRPTPQIKLGTIELVITTIPRAVWGDVWQLQLTAQNRAGVLARILDVLSSSRVEVIFNEGCVHSFAQYDSMSFILSMLDHYSPRDHSTHQRNHTNFPRLPDLEFLFLFNLLNDIAFDESGSPRFSLKRLNMYWHLLRAEDLQTYKRIDDGSGLILDDCHCFTPEQDFFAKLNYNLGHHIDYATSVDTSDRCIRILFFSASVDGPGFVQFVCPNMSSAVLQRIIDIVSKSGANIIRNQIRGGIPPTVVGKLGRVGGLVGIPHENPARVDLTIEPTDPAKTTQDVVKSLHGAVAADPLLEDQMVDISATLP